MATWPGKEADTPTLKSNGDTEYVIRTRMQEPCNKAMRGTGAAKDPKTAYVYANNILNRNVKTHKSKCKKCPDRTN